MQEVPLSKPANVGPQTAISFHMTSNPILSSQPIINETVQASRPVFQTPISFPMAMNISQAESSQMAEMRERLNSIRGMSSVFQNVSTGFQFQASDQPQIVSVSNPIFAQGTTAFRMGSISTPTMIPIIPTPDT